MPSRLQDSHPAVQIVNRPIRWPNVQWSGRVSSPSLNIELIPIEVKFAKSDQEREDYSERRSHPTVPKEYRDGGAYLQSQDAISA